MSVIESGPFSGKSKNFMVTFEFIGEGYDGDYHDLSPDDAPLYRCDIFFKGNLDEPIRNGSFCTNIPANKGFDLRPLLNTMLEHLEDLLEDHSNENMGTISKIMGAYSWYDETSDFNKRAV